MTSPPSILLADDNPDDVLIFCRAFKKAGFMNPVQVVTDGEMAIQYLRGEGAYADRSAFPLPYLLLLDLKMPRLGGLEVIQWVRSQSSGIEQTPVIVLTTSSHGPDVSAAYRAGANSFLVKPTDLADFVRQMKVMGDFWLRECQLPTGPNSQPAAPPVEPHLHRPQTPASSAPATETRC